MNTQKNTSVMVTINNNTQSFPVGTTLREILDSHPEADHPIMAAMVNNKLQELSYPIFVDSVVDWLDNSNIIGRRIYKRSLYFLLVLASKMIFPERKLYIEHSLSIGTYCELRGDNPLTTEDIEKIDAQMRKIVSEKKIVEKKTLGLDDAINFFRSSGQIEKSEILKNHREENINIYSCCDYADYLYGYICPCTCYLKYFSLQPFDKGFIVYFPKRDTAGTVLPDYKISAKISTVFGAYEKVGDLLNVGNVYQLNKISATKKENIIAQVAETFHERELYHIAQDITAKSDKVRIILIAGPSASGKTTFSHRLSIQLRANGIIPKTISLDDYFINRDDTPKDEFGDYDFENIHALDLDLFNQHLQLLINGQEVSIPKYEFTTGKRSAESRKMQLGTKDILIIEGIHGLNEELTKSIPHDNKRKIYISALTQLNLDNYYPISSSDTRLIRRMSRDLLFRGITPQETIRRWPSVRRGEEKYIFPYQDDADYIFNSALVYETAVLKVLIESKLEEIGSKTPEYWEATRILSFLKYFDKISPNTVPSNSILREFTGGGCFRE